MIRSLFINPYEHRLRAFWRLLFQAVLFFIGTTLFGILVGIVAVGILAVQGGNVQDAQTLSLLLDRPGVRVLAALGSLLSMFISYWIAARWFDHRPIHAYGFHLNKRWWADFAFGLFLGAFILAFIFLVELAAGWITITSFFHSFQPGVSALTNLLVSLIVFICVGIYEEMFSRGYQIRNLAEGLNFRFLSPRIALLLGYLGTSIFFGLLHAGNQNATLVSTLSLMIAGLFLGLGYVLTGELALPIGMHITWNFFEGNVFGFPVSGSRAGATLIAIQQNGPEVWTGGAFGPEAGLIVIVAMAAGVLLILAWVRWVHGLVALQDQLAVYQPVPSAQAGQTEPLSSQHPAPFEAE